MVNSTSTKAKGLAVQALTHWGQATHECVSTLTIISPDNGLLPGRRQAIIWTNAGILLIRTLGTKFSEILSEIHSFSFKKIPLKMSSGKWHPFCLGLNVLKINSVGKKHPSRNCPCICYQSCCSPSKSRGRQVYQVTDHNSTAINNKNMATKWIFRVPTRGQEKSVYNFFNSMSRMPNFPCISIAHFASKWI